MSPAGPALQRDPDTPGSHPIVTPTPPSRLMTAHELAAFLQLDPDRLYDMRNKGTGPAFVKIGRDVRYAWPDVREWLRSRTYTSTAAAS